MRSCTKTKKSIKARKRLELQNQIEVLYKQGRANLKPCEKRLFQLPVEQRQKKGIESMMLWINLVEAIFCRRGQAHQVQIDVWLTGTTPEMSWKDRYKNEDSQVDKG